MVGTEPYISSDSHVHLLTEKWADRVPEKYRDQLPRRIKLPNGSDGSVDASGNITAGGTGHFSGHGPEGFDPTIIRYESEAGHGGPEQRLKEQQIDGIDAEIMFSNPSPIGLRGNKDNDSAVAIAHAYNAYLAEEFCSYARDRFLGIGVLAHRGVDEDIAEMEHCARLGLRGVQLTNYPSGKPHPTPEDDRFWAAAIDLDVPITIHTSMQGRPPGRGEFAIKYPIEPEGYDRPPVDLLQLMSRYMTHHCGGLELTQMILTGLFDRVPRLKIFWAENNIGWLPIFLEQMDMNYEANHFWAERQLGLKPLTRRPSEYAHDHAYWGFFDDPFGVRHRQEIGVDHILWGGDFPHEVSRWPHTREVMPEQMAGVPDDERRMMMSENTINFFHLDR
jgi:uncharacterized protein